MRDDSSIDPAGTQQPPQAPYASGLTQPEASQQPQTRPTQQTAETFETPQGETGAERVRGNTDVPTTQTQTQTEPVQAQAPSSQGQGVQGQQGMQGQAVQGQGQGMQGQGMQDQGIWDATKADQFRHRWHDVQTHFVEDPRGSVSEARQLVDEAVQALADSVHEREDQLDRAGARSSDSTEGMRDTVLQYHQLLDRLLTV